MLATIAQKEQKNRQFVQEVITVRSAQLCAKYALPLFTALKGQKIQYSALKDNLVHQGTLNALFVLLDTSVHLRPCSRLFVKPEVIVKLRRQFVFPVQKGITV